MAMLECPNISEATLGLTFCVSRRVAHVCLRSWKRKCGSPARLRSGLNRREVRSRRSRVAAVEGRARLGGEHQPVLLPQGASLIYLLQLALQVALEDFGGSPGEAYAPTATLRFGSGESGTSLCSCQGAPYVQRPGIKVDVVPLEPQQLTLPESSVDGEYVEGFETISAGCVEQHLDLLGGQRAYLLPAHLWRLDGLGRVARDETIAHSLLERLVERDVDVLDGAGT
jgi:hypothetical protein